MSFVSMKSSFILMLLALPGINTAWAAQIKELDAGEVKLLPGSVFYERQELHRKGYLASFDCDKLLYHYRVLAKLPQPEGVNGGYDGWDSGFLRGHMAGHYLSAASRMVAASGDDSYRKKVDYMVAELAKCQEALQQGGYLAAFPSGAFDRLEGKPGDGGGVVVPYYTIHKIMAGLVDAYHYLGNEQALQVALQMADYFEKRLAAVDAGQMEKMFRTDGNRNPQNEFGAMSDVLAELYDITGDKKHLDTALLFNRSWFIDPLAKGEDHLAGLHGNTHVAQIMGIAHCANIIGDETSLKASENFWQMVTKEHSFVIGGNSFKEWMDKPGVETGPSIDGQKELPATTAETCNTHNMLKITARLFEREQQAQYADYFERALYNHILASVAPDTGFVTYFTPLRGQFRTYLKGTHCCVGSGIENTPRYNEGIYFEGENSLWVNLYIPSELNAKDSGLVIRQEGDITCGEPAKFTIVKTAGGEKTFNFRIPGWVDVDQPVEVRINGQIEEKSKEPSSFVSLTRQWKEGDVVSVTLPMALRLEYAKDNKAMAGVFYGPILLAGELGKENMPDDHADKDAYVNMSPVPVPDIVSSSADPSDWLMPVEDEKLEFKVQNAGKADGVVFRPLYSVHHQRYSVYWLLKKPE